MNDAGCVIEEELHIVHKSPKCGSEFRIDIGIRHFDNFHSLHAFEDAENPFPARLTRLQIGERRHGMPFAFALC